MRMMNKPAIEIGENKVYSGHNLEILKTFDDNSIDSIVTDPPYELGFMSKSWDSTGIAYSVELWRECLRVLKPGGHLLAFGGSRTWHRLAVAIEDAGFEMRDSIAWLYGSGFPKSHNISKAIDKLHGAEREVIGQTMASPKGISQAENRSDTAAGAYGGEAKLIDITAPATDDARKWDGWGTALKPAFEPIVVARKPLIGTVAENVLQFGTGGINIDASRIGTEQTKTTIKDLSQAHGNQFGKAGIEYPKLGEKLNPPGRWPANVILDETTAELLDEQSGIIKSVATNRGLQYSGSHGGLAGEHKQYKEGTDGVRGHTDSGGVSRFFYVAKASKRDRNEGLDELPLGDRDFMGSGGRTKKDGIWVETNSVPQQRQNFHPTVKPTQLMKYLIKLVTPEAGIVLDPFAGSGSTGKAAILEGYTFIGIELTDDYLPIIEGRLQHAYETYINKADDLFE